jgi:hypothetical protein
VRPWLERELTVVTSRHLKVGWWSLLVFLTMGLVLESLHGFKVGAYLNISNETRRLMWTLAHAHGTLLALVQIAFAFTVRLMPGWPERARGLVSASFIAAGWLMPLGFFLGGLVIYSGDPGLGILLVPVGGLLLLVAVFATARALSRWKVEGAEAKIRKQR